MLLNKSIILFLIPIFLLVACKNDLDRHLINSKKIEIKSFPKECKLVGQKVDINLYGIETISIIDTFLIGFDLVGRRQGKFLKIYSTNSHKYLGSLIDRGKGPNELIMIQSQEQYFKNKEGCHLWIADNALFNKSYCLNVTKSLAEKKTVMDTSLVLKKYSAPFKFFINDSLVFGLCRQNLKGMGCKIYHLKKRKIISESWLFDGSFEDLKHDMMYRFQFSNLKPDTKDRIACASGQLHRIYILDLNLRNSLEIDVENFDSDLRTIKHQKNIRYTYNNVKVTKDYIYVLLGNKTDDEFFDSNCKLSGELQVFTWDGEPILKAEIKENIWAISIDEQNHYLYGYTSYEDLYRYDLSTILK